MTHAALHGQAEPNTEPSEKLLNAALRVLVLPLDARLDRVSTTVPAVVSGASRLDDDERRAFGEVFADGQFHRCSPEDLQAMTIGFGRLELVATRTFIDGSGPELRFGRSRGTVLDCLDRDEPLDAEFLWHLRPAVALSLWNTDDGLVITAEHLQHDGDVDISPTGDTWADATLLGAGTLDRLLRPTTVNPGHTLTQVFGAEVGALLTPADRERPLHELLIPTADVVRGTAIHEGLYVVVAAEASDESRALTGPREPFDFDRSEYVQAVGIDWEWSSLEIVKEPAEPGALSAVREDSRAVLLNLESTSVWHDYAGVGAGTQVLACIPYVAERGRLTLAQTSVARLVASIQNGTSRAGTLLEDVDAVRLDLLQRRLRRERLSPERFVDWTHGGQLVTRLVAGRREADEMLVGNADKVAVFAQNHVTVTQERHDKKVQGWLAIGTPVAGFAGLASVAASLAAVPGDDAGGPMFSLGLAALLTVALIVAGLGVGVVIALWRSGRTPRQRRRVNGAAGGHARGSRQRR